MRRLALALALALPLATGCAKSGDAEVAAEGGPAVPEEPPAAWSATTPLAPIPDHDGPVRYQSLNMELVVDKPADAMAAARALVLSLGGEVTAANASEDVAASLTASMPPHALERLQHGVGKIPGTVRSENLSTNDMTQHCDQLRDRLRQLGIADAELERIMRTTREESIFEAMLVQRELGTRERESLRQQLTQQIQQAKRAQVYLTFQPRTAVPPDGVIRDPIRGWREHG
jgi:hypothetical protein